MFDLFPDIETPDDLDGWHSEAYQPPAERVPAAAAEARELLSSGLTLLQAAERLCVSPETVELLVATYDHDAEG